MYERKIVILPEHEVDLSGVYCHECETLMKTWVGDGSYYVNGTRVVVYNIQGCWCPSCGNKVYSSNEAELIESAIHNAKE